MFWRRLKRYFGFRRFLTHPASRMPICREGGRERCGWYTCFFFLEVLQIQLRLLIASRAKVLFAASQSISDSNMFNSDRNKHAISAVKSSLVAGYRRYGSASFSYLRHQPSLVAVVASSDINNADNWVGFNNNINKNR